MPQNLPDLDIKQYNHWKDWSYNLQVSDTELPGVKESHRFGHALHVIGGCR